jgi:hypothetical protein
VAIETPRLYRSDLRVRALGPRLECRRRRGSSELAHLRPRRDGEVVASAEGYDQLMEQFDRLAVEGGTLGDDAPIRTSRSGKVN